MAELFASMADYKPAGIAHRFGLGVYTIAGDNRRLEFRLTDDRGFAHRRTLALAEPHRLDDANFHYDTLTEVITLEVAPAELTSELQHTGLAGFSFDAAATLVSVRIVLRPRPQGGTWSAQAPCFALLMCWRLEASASGGVETTEGEIDAAASAQLELCCGLSIIEPYVPELGLPNLQMRIDLPDFSVTTTWLQLATFFKLDLAMPLSMDGFLAWFGKLTRADFGELPVPGLPDWDFDTIASLELPFAAGAETCVLALARNTGSGTLAVVLELADFYVEWGPDRTSLGGEVRLTHADESYTLRARLLRAQYPTTLGAGPYSFSLPLDVLSITAECWYLRVGLYAGGKIDDSPVRVCLELLLEIGGLQLYRGKPGLPGAQQLYRADLRLLARDFKVMTIAPPEEGGREFFDEVDNPVGPLARYRQQHYKLPALSFAQDLTAPPLDPALANDYGLTVIEGDVRISERIFLLWRQHGLRVLRALAHDVLGHDAAGKVQPDEQSIVFALEYARFDQTRQLRLDWMPEETLVPPAHPATPADPSSPLEEGCVLAPSDGKPIRLHFPAQSDGVALVLPAAAAVLALPAVSLEMARAPRQAIVLQKSSDVVTLGHLMFYDAPPIPAAAAALPLARARIGFSLERTGDRTKRPEAMETSHGTDLLTVAIGNASAQPVVLRTIGWSGGAPRFLQVQKPDMQPFSSLIPALLPTATAETGCPGAAATPAPPTRYVDTDFVSPALREEAWRLSVEAQVSEQLFKAFSADQAGYRIGFKIDRICPSADGNAALVHVRLSFEMGDKDDFHAEGKIILRLDLGSLALGVEDDAELAIFRTVEDGTPSWAATAALPQAGDSYWYGQEIGLMGFRLTAMLPKPQPQGDKPDRMAMLSLAIQDGKFLLSLPKDTLLVLRYTRLGTDSLNFLVSELVIGPGGLDLDARLLPSTITVRGLKRPFQLEQAALRMRGSRLEHLSVDGSGKLPALLNEAPVSIRIAFIQERAGGPVDLAELHCELGDKDTPILSRGTRFKFEITKLGIQYASESSGAERHFFFEVSGSAQFTPEGTEFAGGLLEDLKSARIEFIRAPLSDEFHKSLGLVVELKKPVTFDVFKLFRMEIRSFGFEPHCTLFAEPGPALVIGGQCEFARFGDVVSAEISFHAMRIGLPKQGDAMPQVHFDGLRVDISSPEGFRIGGRVDRYDRELLKGFAGEGTVQIPGLPELSAAFSFVRLRKSVDDPWQHAWFIAIEAAKISYQVGPLPIYLRQIGLGFGFRFTLPLVAEFDKKGHTVRELINRLLKALDEHHSLARIDSWTAIPGNPDWTIALEAVFTLGSANTGPYAYNAKQEQRIKSIIAQTMAAFRSDFTVLAALKLWYPVSVDDFFTDVENMRRRPLVSGFLIYSAPQNRMLAHAAKGADPYMGPPNDPVPEMLKDILRGTHYESTLLIEPSLVHAELGWPDRLLFGLKLGALEVECRGGVLFRLERDLLIQGTFFSARGSLALGGGFDGGFVGARIEAFVEVHFATRLLTAMNLRSPVNSCVYAALGLDLAVRFSVHAWLRLEIGFAKISLDIEFALHLQISVALELGWAGEANVGFRGRATVAVRVFGRALGVSVAVGINESGVNTARDVLQPYMGSLLEPGKAPPMPGIDTPGLRRARALSATTVDFTDPAGHGEGAPGREASTVLATEAQAEAEAAALDTAAPVPASAGADFVSAHVGGVVKLWFVWIMPGPGAAAFYPVPVHDGQQDWVAYAQFAHEPGPGERIHAWKDGWHALDQGKGTLWMRPGAGLDTETESGNASSQKLTLEQMIAGCWVPASEQDYEHPTTEGKVTFPFYWSHAEQAALRAPARQKTRGEPLRDERVYAPGDPHAAPSRHIDMEHPYDRSLLDANALTADAYQEDDLPQTMENQARGNQSFLVQSFHDDLVRIAATSTMGSDGVPVTPHGQGSSLLDTGMLLCVQADKRPDWIASRSAAAYPEIGFLGRDGKPAGTQAVWPVVEFDMVDFGQNPPRFDVAPVYLDEHLVGLAWNLAWPGQAPLADEGADKDVEAFLRAYEVSFFDAISDDLLYATSVTPSRLEPPHGKVRATSPPTDLRYRFTIPREQLLGRSSGQTVRQVRAVVQPMSQTGHLGASHTFDIALEPLLTPLPADNAQCEMSVAADGKRWSARLSWRELALPPRDGIADTEAWHLVLRPLAEVPLGAYPDDAAEPGDRGLMSVTGQALIDGDIVIELPKPASEEAKKAGYTRVDPDGNNDPERDSRDPASYIHLLQLDPRNDLPGKVYDHLGVLHTSGPLVEQALSFFRHDSAIAHDGGAWRLFLRASASLTGAKRMLRGLSGLTQVPLLLRDDTPSADKGGPVVRRPLPHLEWPAPATLRQITGLEAGGGAVAVALAIGSLSQPGLHFVAKPGRERAITLSWNALQDTHRFLHAYAAYDVFELPLDALVNADEADDGSFAPPWRFVRRVLASDAGQAAQAPCGMHDVANWEAQYPAFACTHERLQRADPPVAPREMAARWPGWYSWADSELHWPAEADLLKGEVQEWKALGQNIARSNLHGYLAAVLGHMSQAAGKGSYAVYELQVVAGQPVALRDPFKWFTANTEELDPYGWAALSHLGLSLTLSMRDPLTGLMRPQGELRARLLDALEAVDAAAGAAWRPHVMVELPLQHARAYRALPGGGATLDDCALDLLQVSLRPVPRPLATYAVATVKAIRSDVPLPPESVLQQVDIQFPLIHPDTAGTLRPGITLTKGNAALLPAAAFRIGDIIMVRDLASVPSQDSVFLQALLQLVELDLHRNYGEAPFGMLKADGRELVKSPYGRFPVVRSLLHARLDESESSYRRFEKRLLAAFADTTGELPAGTVQAPAGAKELDAYLDWSGRFFASAPLEKAPPGAEIAPDCALAQPKSIDPMRVAADGRGRLTMTRFVEEEWACERSYAVLPTARYDKLLASMGHGPQQAPLPALDAGRADVALPRIRRLEPPKLLAAHIVRSARQRSFHQLILAHPERELAHSNTSVMRKLVFGDVQRSYQREFRYGPWLRVLHRAVLVSAPAPGLPTSSAHTGEPGTGDACDNASTLLAQAPQARWNATRYLDAAEPFYYEQRVRLGATAGDDVSSEVRSVLLPLPEPGPTVHLGDPPVSIRRTSVHQVWQEAFDGTPMKTYFDSGYLIEVRWPRLVESLDPGSVDTYYAAERELFDVDNVPHAAYGLLPDPEIRILIAQETPAGTIVVGQCVAQAPQHVQGAQEPPPFVFGSVSERLSIANATPLTGNGPWPEGIRVRGEVKVDATGWHVVSAPGMLADVALPTELVAYTVASRLPPDALPDSDALAQLAPLAARLALTVTETGTTMRVDEPLVGPRWLCRPHLPPSDTAPMEQLDLALGLRMAFDGQRRAAAALVAFDAGSARPPLLVGLLRGIEESESALLLADDRTLEIAAADLESWREAGLTLWRRGEEGEAGQRQEWERVTAPATAPARWHCVVCRPPLVADPVEAGRLAEIRRQAWNQLDLYLPDGLVLDQGRVRSLNEALDRLAALAYRATALQLPVLFAQRGNEKRTPWPSQP